jgi:hypothetical protein
LVGDRVHVEGTLARRSNLGDTGDDRNHVAGTAGSKDEVMKLESGREIKQKDLAEISVSAAQRVSGTCGGRVARTKP